MTTSHTALQYICMSAHTVAVMGLASSRSSSALQQLDDPRSPGENPEATGTCQCKPSFLVGRNLVATL